MPEVKPNFTKEAFLQPLNLVFLLVALLTAFFLTGVPADVLLLFTAAIELLYLGIVPRNERFRRVIRSRAVQEHRNPASEADVLQTLSRSSQKRYVSYRTLEKQIAENYKKLSYASQGILDAHLAKLDALLDSYLSLLSTKERYHSFTERTAETDVVNSIAALRDEIKVDPPRVRAVKERRLSILEKRLERYKKALENLAIIEAQLETIEDVTKYIYEQSLTMRNPEEVSFQLDTLVNEVEETQAAVEQVEEIFASPNELLSGMDLYEPPSLDDEPQEDPDLATRDRLRS
ncbi:hypothetical protein BH23BAC4_BH23BAC4_06300 [soil metagenome]